MVNRQDVRRNKNISNDEILKDIIAVRQSIRLLRHKKPKDDTEKTTIMIQIKSLKESLQFLQDLLIARAKK